MLTKHKDARRLDPEKGANEFFENDLWQRRIQNCYGGGGGTKCLHFLSVAGSVESILRTTGIEDSTC